MNASPPEVQAVRRRGLGAFAAWPDELVAFFLANAQLSTRELLALSCTSRLMRLMVCEEPLWLQRHLHSCRRPFKYRGSWRATCLAYLPDSGRPGLIAADLLPPASVPGFSSDVLYRRWYRCHVDLSTFLPGLPQLPAPSTEGSNNSSRDDHARAAAAVSGGFMGGAANGPPISVISDASGMSAEEFEARFDAPRCPALLGGLTAGWPGEWGGLEAWQPARLAQLFGDQLFKVTKPFMAAGRTKMRLADYLAYCSEQHDEEPLYIFDSSLAETAPQLAAQYTVPHLFRHDLFSCLGYKREDHRWLVVGPKRSGASWHVDPSATSAWNTLLSGRKRWALYPPGQVPPGVQVHIDADGQPSFQAPTSLQWYLEMLPQLPPGQRPLEVVQQAGETIFVPAGWWHCVLNLDLTVAVTQNFVSPANLEAAVQWQALGAGALGSMFDPYLVPAYLQLRQAETGAGAEQQQNGQERSANAQEGPPSKRRRQAPHAEPPQQHQGRHQQQEEQALPCEVDQGQNDEHGEAAERQTAANKHLRELSMGFSKGGLLAPWLRQLLRQLRPGTDDDQAAQLQQQQQQQQQSLDSRVWQLAQQWTELSAWQPRVSAACAAAGLPPPGRRHEWLPLTTGTCVVFEVAGAILKFFHPEDPHSSAMAAMEAAAYCCMKQAAGSGRAGRADDGSSGDLLLGAGLLEIPAGQNAAAALPAEHAAPREREATGGLASEASLKAQLAAPLPFVVLRKVAGVTIGSCSDRLSRQQCDGSGGCSTAWMARDGIAYSSALGTVDLREAESEGPEQLLQRQRLMLIGLFPQAAALLGVGGAGVQQAEGHAEHPGGSALGCSASAPHQGAAEAAGGRYESGAAAPACSCRRCRAWQPFLCFLRRQRRHAATAHRRDESLPQQLLEQVECYLPPDPAVLLGFGSGCACRCSCRAIQQRSSGSPRDLAAPGQARAGIVERASVVGTACGGDCTGSKPTWVHGDLTAENILLSNCLLESGGQAPQEAHRGQGATGAVLIDFADSGHGDPLFDLVPLLLRTFRCDQQTAGAFLASYCGAFGPEAPPPSAATAAPAPWPLPASWPRRLPGTPLSFVAMCYTLLHELGLLHDVFKRRPELWEARSLEKVQAELWGWLDCLFESS
ncbi:hypothetical protein ABPG77_011406 [Micractinium sp. CCAP 211/92]